MSPAMDSFGMRLAREFEGTGTLAPHRDLARQPASRPSQAAAAEGRADVAVLVHDLRASGVVLNAIRIAETARQAHLTTELWVIRDEGPLLDKLPPGLRLRRLRTGASGLPRAMDSMAGVPQLVAALRRHRPAILFSAGNHVHTFAALAHRLANVPGMKLIGRVSNALAATTPPKRAGWRGRLTRAAAIRLEQIQYRAMDQLIAVSHELANQLADQGCADPTRITVIPNGVDVELIRRKSAEPLQHPWFAEGAPPVVVAVGRLCRQKNFAQLVRAFALLRRKKPSRLVILGSGSQGERDALLRLARALKVEDDVWLAGYEANPYRFMARSSVFVMTSRWEGGSNVLIEALACGLPVVATDCPAGVREVLSHRPDSRLVPLDDVYATAKAMEELLGSPQAPANGRIDPYRLRNTLARYQAVLAGAVAEVSGKTPGSL